MSRDNITNKGSSQNDKPKSEWFGFKYRVNPETSKLLQESVFKDGGRWAGSRGTTLMGTYMEYMYVTYDGIMSYGNGSGIFNKNPLPEKEPPQPDKTFKTHQHIGSCKEIPLTNKVFECTLGNVVKVEVSRSTSSIDVVNEINNFLNQQEEINMSNTNRRVVNVKLLDNDSGLPVENSLVAQFDNIVTEDSNDVVVQEILLNKNIADAIAKHNQKRVEQTDLEILKRTGNDVKLRPVKLKDLTWVVTTA